MLLNKLHSLIESFEPEPLMSKKRYHEWFDKNYSPLYKDDIDWFKENMDRLFSKIDVFEIAASAGAVKIMSFLMHEIGIDPSKNDNQAIISAARSGKPKAVKLLLSDPRVDPSARDNEALRLASVKYPGGYPGGQLRNNYNYSVIELLLKDPRVKPKRSWVEWVKKYSNDDVLINLFDTYSK